MYAEFEIEITVKPNWFKRKFGIRFDMLSFFRMMEEFGIALGDDMGKLSKVPFDEMLCTAVFTGYESYCFKHKRKMLYTKDQILKWTDNGIITRGHFKQIGGLWTEFMADWTEKNEKKKVKAGV
jgi:hypothetical protein